MIWYNRSRNGCFGRFGRGILRVILPCPHRWYMEIYYRLDQSSDVIIAQLFWSGNLYRYVGEYLEFRHYANRYELSQDIASSIELKAFTGYGIFSIAANASYDFERLKPTPDDATIAVFPSVRDSISSLAKFIISLIFLGRNTSPGLLLRKSHNIFWVTSPEKNDSKAVVISVNEIVPEAMNWVICRQLRLDYGGVYLYAKLKPRF